MIRFWILLGFFFEVSAFGFGLPVIGEPTVQLLPEYDFEGIVAASNCSASLVRYDDSEDTDPGLIMTNGHCVGFLDPGVVLVNRTSRRRFQFLSPSGSTLGSVRSTRLLFATMTDTDMALYELQSSYADIESRFDVRPLTISREEPQEGDPIDIISGYWKRGYSCSIDKKVFQLKEGNWTFKDSLRYTQPGCEVIGGTSGSPIILAGTRTAIAINNTGNESGMRCTLNNPCEIDDNGDVYYEKGQNYGQQIFWLYSCRDESGELDLNLAGCLLPRP